jgi:hypothetical protein
VGFGAREGVMFGARGIGAPFESVEIFCGIITRFARHYVAWFR